MISQRKALDLLEIADSLNDAVDAASLRRWVAEHYTDSEGNELPIKESGDFALYINGIGGYSFFHTPSRFRLSDDAPNLGRALTWMFYFGQIEASAGELSDEARELVQAVVLNRFR